MLYTHTHTHTHIHVYYISVRSAWDKHTQTHTETHKDIHKDTQGHTISMARRVFLRAAALSPVFTARSPVFPAVFPVPVPTGPPVRMRNCVISPIPSVSMANAAGKSLFASEEEEREAAEGEEGEAAAAQSW